MTQMAFLGVYPGSVGTQWDQDPASLIEYWPIQFYTVLYNCILLTCLIHMFILLFGVLTIILSYCMNVLQSQCKKITLLDRMNI